MLRADQRPRSYSGFSRSANTQYGGQAQSRMQQHTTEILAELSIGVWVRRMFCVGESLVGESAVALGSGVLFSTRVLFTPWPSQALKFS